MAQKTGLSEPTLKRARQALGIRCRRVYANGRPVSYWLLRDQELPADLADPADLSPWLAVLEKQFPPATPLDEDDRDGGPG